MQLLCVHAASFGFEARNPDPGVDRATDQTAADVAGAVVVFVAVERADPHRPATTARGAAAIVDDVTDQLNTPQVALVPCRRLTDSPADRDQVAGVLDRLAVRVDANGDADQPEVARVPIGWDVALDIETRAHPHAVKHFVVEPETDTADSEWLCYVDGSFSDCSAVTLDAETTAVLDWERGDAAPTESGVSSTGSAFGLFESDGDRVTLQPRGVVARDLLDSFVSETLAEYGAVPVDRLGTHDRSVVDQESVSEAAFPIRLFESRRDPPALADSRSLPAETVPELSALVADLPAAFDEVCEHAAVIHRLWSALGLSAVPVVRVRSDAFDRHRDSVAALAALFDRPVLVERRPTADWLLQLDFQTLSAGVPVTTPTVLLDDTAGEPLDDGSDPALVRSLPVGAIERTLGTLLDRHSGLPAWLAPVQLRLVPIDPSAHLAYCDQVADQLPSVRLDIDDRDVAVRERLEAADEAGIPYYAVIGDDELESGQIGVIHREQRIERDRSLDQLRAMIVDDSLCSLTQLPRYVSDMPGSFV